MKDLIQNKRLHRLIDKWADENFARAEKFVELHTDISERQIGTSQLFGMYESASQGVNSLLDYINNRIIRARRGGLRNIERYYSDLAQEITSIREEARSLVKEYSLGNKEYLVPTLERDLVKKYLQHIIAHNKY